jgi:SAM-dependent methyltransferase
MKRFLNSAKKIIKKKPFKKLDYILNFSQKETEDFIIKTARREIKPGSRILDAGAGSVKYKKFFQDCIYKTQDFKQYGEIDYLSDIIKIPVESNSFDVIICTEVLEHIPRPDSAIKEFSRILKNGGSLYLTAPLMGGIHQAPYHFYGGFSRFWYLKFLNEYGFKEINIKPKRGFFAFYGQETLRAMLYFIKSKKWKYKIFAPLAVLLILTLVPLFFYLDKKNLDADDSFRKFTAGYLIKAKK